MFPLLRISHKYQSCTVKMNNNNRPVPWQDSDAKKELALLILDGTVTANSDPNQVYNSSIEYQQYDIKNFKRNLKSLIHSLAKKEENALFDAAAVAHDRQLYPRPALTSGGYPFWDTSEARVLLSADIDADLHLAMSPRDLWNSRDEYQVFPSHVFRQHIHQESVRRLAKGFFLNKNANKEK
jgi:hypothetical protein